MGLFGRKRAASNRVAEGGGEEGLSRGAVPSGGGASSSSLVDRPKPKAAAESLDIFGADSDESDDDAAIAKYLDDVGDGNGDDAQDIDAENRKVSVLTSKASLRNGSRLAITTRTASLTGKCVLCHIK